MDSPAATSEAGLPVESVLQRADSKPTLLPAFEPTSSSPALPRPAKRKFEGSPGRGRAFMRDYLTPVPSSSTDVLPSSPPLRPSTRPGLDRNASNVSERAPLATLSSVEIPLNGEPLLMGRSSNSSHFQLSANRLISRIHVRAQYTSPNETHENGQVVVECLGWNGAKVHCRGKVFELGKGDTFTSDKPHTDMLVDVQDARVLVRWPPITVQRQTSPSRWSDDDSPRRPVTPGGFASSPPPLQLHSPVSPSPRDRPAFTTSSTFLGLPASSPVRVYEDVSDLGQTLRAADPIVLTEHFDTLTPVNVQRTPTPPISDIDDFSDEDEENDPIVHAMGPTGLNVLARMASFTTGSPERRRLPLKASVTPQHSKSPKPAAVPSKSPIRNHVINQLAYSRLQSIPLNTILKNLPNALKAGDARSNGSEERMTSGFTHTDLEQLLHDIPCVGEITREGNDAAGKPLENEFYYLPELDTDEMRRSVVENNLGKHTLRATRKQHKQYFWKRPRV